MKKGDIRILILAAVLLLPSIGLTCGNPIVALVAIIYLAVLSTLKKFWAKVYKASMRLGNLIIK